MGSFLGSVDVLQLTVVVTDNFKGDNPTPVTDPVALSYPSGNLLITFSGPNGYTFKQTFSFRIETKNREDLTYNATAQAFNNGNLIASASPPGGVIPAGGETRLSLTLGPSTGNPDGGSPDSGYPDPPINVADPGGADVTIKGATKVKPVTTVAICNLTGYLSGELVIGVPSADSRTTEGTGAVYVLPSNSPSPVDLSNLPAQEFHVYGVNSGDKLGAAVGCVDINDDNVDELVIGAPGAYGIGGGQDTGRVYVIKGRSTLLNSTAIDLANNEADIEWVGGAMGTFLGTTVLASNMQGGGNAEILIAAPGEGAAGLVHLVSLSGLPAPGSRAPQLLTGTTGHATFAGVKMSPLAMAIGDLDGDGAVPGGSEVVLGYSGAQSSRGAVYVFGNVNPSAALARDVAGSGALGPQLIRTGTSDNDAFGAAVLVLDLWGGGPDLVVGAPGEQGGTGAVRILEHNDTIFTEPMAKLPLTVAAGGRFGSALASVVSGGGSSANLLVGAPSTASGTKTLAGAIYLFEPVRSTLPKRLLTIVGAEMNDKFGTTVTGGAIGTGDPNNTADTKGDLFVVAPNANGTTGAAYVRYAP